MTNEQLLAGAKQVLSGKNFFIDWFHSKKQNADYKVICYTIDDSPEYIRADRLINLISQ